jgi:peptidoglycan/LPS O-acetylase OafA/YrhL
MGIKFKVFMFYRKEIDGLRAIAVLAVMFFHANFLFVRGGFVGVDVFFVISGYLITQIIVTQIQAGTFSLVHFYERRARRILPALFVMMLICLPVAWLIIINPADLKDFCKSFLAVALSASNILFWKESGYFDSSTALKPLLHTWSLAVEEQYYLIFPFLMLIGWRAGAKRTLLLTMILGLSSLVFAQWSSVHQPVFNFYWLPTRMWELLAGAMIPIAYAVYPRLTPPRSPRSGIIDETLGLCGIVLILSSVCMMNEQFPWPSFWTVIPVIGAVLILLFASNATLAGRLLGARPLVSIGLVSYSAYLWHQPLLAFARYQFDALTLGFRLALVLAALALGWLSWKYIETPFRNKNRFSSKQIFISAATFIVLFAAIGLTGYFRSGFLYRLPAQSEPVFSYVMKNFMQDIRSDKCFIQSRLPADRFSEECSQTSEVGGTVVLWGDSHAAALYTGLKKYSKDVVQFTAGSCPPIFWNTKEHPSCQALNQYALQEILRLKPSVIYMEADWLAYPGDLMVAAQTIQKIRQVLPSVQIVLIGNVPHWPKGLPREVLQSSRAYDDTLYLAVPESMLSGLKGSDQQLENFAQEQGIQFVSVLDLVCNQLGCQAITMTDNGPKLTAFDYGHLTKAGSESFVAKMLRK